MKVTGEPFSIITILTGRHWNTQTGCNYFSNFYKKQK